MRASAHHSIRKFFAVGITIVALGVLAPVGLGGDTKAVPTWRRSATPGRTASSPRRTRSDPRGIGDQLHRPGPRPPRSGATIKNGSTTGHCAIGSIFASPSTPGTCVLEAGTGRLTQFHLDAAVTFDGTRWYWDGWYWFGN